MGIETVLLLASTAATVIGSVMQGQAQQEASNAQAQEALNQGAYAADAYKAQADKIRRAGRAQVGETNAALAASGVKLGEGTPLELKKTIIQRSEEDALTSIMQGNRALSSAGAQASVYGKEGESAMTSGLVRAGSTALGTGVDYLRGGWKG